MIAGRDAYALSIVLAAAGCSFPDYTAESGDEGVEDTSPDTFVAVDSTLDVLPDTTPDAETASDVSDASEADTADALKPCGSYGGTVYLGHCYWIDTTTMSEAAAKAYCTAEGAHLVTIASLAENNMVWDLAKGLARWVGLEAPIATTSKIAFKWVNGEAKVYENWASAEPSGLGACVRMVPTSGLWQTRPCDTLLAVTCERETP